MSHCAQTAVFWLSDKKEGDGKIAQQKYSFKWGNKPVMEISFSSYSKHSHILWVCFAMWLFIVLFTFSPIIFV